VASAGNWGPFPQDCGRDKWGSRGRVVRQDERRSLSAEGWSKPAADAGRASGPALYEFTDRELDALCRWFSAMKYAFPGTEGVMVVSHQQSYSAVGLYNPAGGAPNCLIAKHEVGGATRFFWSTEGDPPRVINDLSEITDAHIRAIEPPRNEKGWLDPTGWMGVYATRLIATAVQVV
jgi:hypothetical protein